MDIRINRLLMQNFKGVKHLEINADGANLKIYGDNATGKTTVFDAFTWVLFGKDSLGRSDFGIKTQDEYGNPIHNLEHSVECELAIDNSILTLRKVYTEKWTKKRGSVEAEFSGHETKYYINEVPSTKKEYEQRIAMYIDENLFKTITNPLYFNENLKWQDRRAILLNLCNNLSDEEIIAKNEEFLPLFEELKGRTVQEYTKIVKDKQRAINDELKAIPQRIQEATLAIPETADIDIADKAVIEQRIADLNNEIIAIRNGAGVNDVELEIKALEEKKTKWETSRCDVSELNSQQVDARLNLQNVEREIDSIRLHIRTIENNINQFTLTADRLREEWRAVNDKQYSDSGMCPTCGQALPAEQIEKAKSKFNVDRANKLDAITEQGKQAKAEIAKLEQSRIADNSKLQTLLGEADMYKAEIERIVAEIAKKVEEFEDLKLKELVAITNRIAELEINRLNCTDGVQAKVDTIKEQIAVKSAKLAEINKAIASQDIAERQKQRIAELSADEKRFATEYSALEKTAFLIEKFIKFKIDMLSEEINGHFKYAKFKLFEEQINGGIAECCEVTFKGVEYADLNNASRINIGIDIINTLCKLNDKFATVFVDNAESVTDILPTTSQMVCLVVSADDDALRVEKN